MLWVRLAHGNSYDNALAEAVNGRYKAEVIRKRGPSRSLEQVELATWQPADQRSNRSRKIIRGLCVKLQLGFTTRLPKTTIVYQYPEGDARLLGQQRCDECGVFGRRLGPGGPCPHCDEMVAISELLAALRSTTIAART